MNTPNHYYAKSRFRDRKEAIARRKSATGSLGKLMSWAISEAKRTPDGSLILDLACGNGRHLAELADDRWHVVGGDISLPMLEATRRLNETRSDFPLVCLEAEALPFSDKAFDVVFCARLFHHLPSRRHRERILAEAMRVARRKVMLTYKARFTYEHVKTRLKVLLRGQWREPRRFFLSGREILDIAEASDWFLESWYSVRGRWSANRVVALRPKE